MERPSDATPVRSRRRGERPMLFLLVCGALALWWTRPRSLPRTEQTNALTCMANLGRISTAFALYEQDNDGKFPRGTDPEDIEDPDSWRTADSYGGIYYNDVHTAPALHKLLLPYVKSPEVWHCLQDNGWDKVRITSMHHFLTHVKPSSYERYGSSYYYWTIHGLAGMRLANIDDPQRELLLFDGEFWHRSYGQLSVNGLYADGHVGNLGERQFKIVNGIP